jgi:hypothetical protein
VSTDDLTMAADPPQAAGSVRVDVARAALQAALDAPEVLGSDSGPNGLRVTADPLFGPLLGVSATAQADGRYAIDLSLVATMVPLPELAEEVRDRVRKRAGREHLDDVLGSINVEFASVMTAEEFAAAAVEQEVQETLVAEEIAAPVEAEEAAEPSGPESGTGERAIPGAVQAPGRTGPAPEDDQRPGAPAAGPRPPGGDRAALAARQAALATDQAALAAKQAALAAEQAALAAGPGAAGSSPEGEREPGWMAEDDEEQKR